MEIGNLIIDVLVWICQHVEKLDLPPIVFHSIGTLLDVYKSNGPNSNAFFVMMHKQRENFQWLDKWDDIEKHIKENALALFNF